MTDTTNSSISFDEALAGYVRTVQAMNDAYYAKNYPNSEVVKSPKIVAVCGSAKVRIIKQDNQPDSGSVHTFVDISTGDILKVASWKAPAPNGKRGNIYDVNYPSCIDHHGAIYRK